MLTADSFLEPVVFGPAVEVTLKGHPFTPEERGQLLKLKVDLDKPFAAAYPIAVWPRIVDIAATSMFPDVSKEEARRALGDRFIRQSTDNAVAKALIPLTQLLGPERFLGRMSRNMRTAFNFVDGEVMESRKGLVLIKLVPIPQVLERLRKSDSDWMVPEFTEGVLQGGLSRFAGAKDCMMRLASRGKTDLAAIFRVEWRT